MVLDEGKQTALTDISSLLVYLRTANPSNDTHFIFFFYCRVYNMDSKYRLIYFNIDTMTQSGDVMGKGLKHLYTAGDLLRPIAVSLSFIKD